MKIVWTRAAQADLEAISDYIKADNPARAASFVNEIVDAGEAISDMPRSFHGLSGMVSAARLWPLSDFLPDSGGEHSDPPRGA